MNCLTTVSCKDKCTCMPGKSALRLTPAQLIFSLRVALCKSSTERVLPAAPGGTKESTEHERSGDGSVSVMQNAASCAPLPSDTVTLSRSAINMGSAETVFFLLM